MPEKPLMIVAIVFVVLTVIMAGLFVVEYTTNNHKDAQYSKLDASYQSQQSLAVLNDAYSHWDYISIENTSLLAPQYSSNATLHWVGGPLTGTYSGIQNISATWDRFFGLWSAIWYYTITPPSVSVHGNTSIVTSMNQFVLTPYNNNTQVQYLNISYILNYYNSNGNWSIYAETWHIVGTGFISPDQQFVTTNNVGNLAFSHWNNIAIENNTTVMQEYASNATLYWIGGPLNGTYHGISEINYTWNRFFGLWSAVWFYAEMPPTVSVHGNSASVSAPVQFVVQNAANTSQFKFINVTYTLDYYSTGFSSAHGMPTYLIYSETFKITGTNILGKL